MSDIARPRYVSGQYLAATDLTAEQAYHHDMRRRHNLGPHTWGIVAGLTLTETDPDSAGSPPDPAAPVDVVLGAGMGLDGFGREVLVLGSHRLDPHDLVTSNLDEGLHPVWLAYDERTPPALRPGQPCEPDGHRTRVHETFRLFYGPPPLRAGGATEAWADPVTLDGHPARVDVSLPHQDLPDAAARWLLPLGWVYFDPSVPTFRSTPHATQGRRYAGVVAASLATPTGQLHLRDRRPDFTSTPPDLHVHLDGSLHIHNGSVHLSPRPGSAWTLEPASRPAGSSATDTLQVRHTVPSPDLSTVVLEVLEPSAGSLHDPILRLAGSPAAVLSAQHVIELTGGETTELHRHPPHLAGLSVRELDSNGETEVTLYDGPEADVLAVVALTSVAPGPGGAAVRCRVSITTPPSADGTPVFRGRASTVTARLDTDGQARAVAVLLPSPP